MSADDERQARLTAAADQFGAAMAESVRAGLVKSLLRALVRAGETGPWVLADDGTLTPVERVDDEHTIIDPNPKHGDYQVGWVPR